MAGLFDNYDKDQLKRAFPDLNFDAETESAKELPLSPEMSASLSPQPDISSPNPTQSDSIPMSQAAPVDSAPSIPQEKGTLTPEDIKSISDAPGTKDKLLAAQKEREDKLHGADLNEYLGLLGQTLSRQDKNLVSPFAQRQREQADLGLKKQKEQIENEVNDPNSDISKVARERLKKAMPELKDQPGYDQLTAAQLEKLFGKPSQSKGMQQVKYQDESGNIRIGKWDPVAGLVKSADDAMAGFAQDLRIDPYTGEVIKNSKASGGVNQQKITPSPKLSPSLTSSGGKPGEVSTEEKEAQEAFQLRNKLNPHQRKSIDENNSAMLKDTQKNRDAITAAQSVRNLLNAPKEGKLDQDILRAIQNQLSRGTGEVGAMTENDVAPFGGRATLLGKLDRWSKMNTTGQLPPEDRKILMQLSKVMEGSAQKGMQQQSRVYQQNITRDTGLPLNQSSKLLGVNAAAMVNPPEVEEEKVKVLNRDGKPGSIPKSKLKDALAHGFTLVE